MAFCYNFLFCHYWYLGLIDCVYLPGGDMGLPVLRQAMEKKGGLLTKDEAVEAMQQAIATFFYFILFYLFKVWWHAATLFIYFYINRADIQYFI
jgi:hypothetical protein